MNFEKNNIDVILNLDRKEIINSLKIFKNTDILYFRILSNQLLITDEHKDAEKGILFTNICYNSKSTFL